MTLSLLEHPANLSLQNKLDKINVMKWLLNLKNSDKEFSELDLQKQIDEISCKNFTRLTVLNHLCSSLPKTMQAFFSKIYAKRNIPGMYIEMCLEYDENLENLPEFRDFNEYLFYNIAKETLHVAERTKVKDDEGLFNIASEIKKTYHILIFSIVYNMCNDMVVYPLDDIIYTFPLLSMWIKENKENKIETLTNDDCEVLAGLYYGLNFDEIIALNLSSECKNYWAINEIIKNLPAKFHVQNITQAIFRVFLLKPFLWSLPTHEEVVIGIKELNNLLP